MRRISLVPSTAFIGAAAQRMEQRRIDKEQERFRTEAREVSDAVPPDSAANWRGVMPEIETEIAARAAPGMSRQETRRVKRQVAKLTAAQARKNARKGAKVERKARRAGLRDDYAR